MKETQVRTVNEAVFRLLPSKSAQISPKAASEQSAFGISELVASVTDSPRRILFTLASNPRGCILHVGEQCELRIPIRQEHPDLAAARILAAVHASVPCGACTVYLADVLEAEFCG